MCRSEDEAEAAEGQSAARTPVHTNAEQLQYSKSKLKIEAHWELEVQLRTLSVSQMSTPYPAIESQSL